MHYHAWRNADGNILFIEYSLDDLERDGPPEPDLEHLYTVEAATWEEAMSIHHLRMGWDPYRPLGKAAPCEFCGALVYPHGTGLCWKCGCVARRPPHDDES